MFCQVGQSLGDCHGVNTSWKKEFLYWNSQIRNNYSFNYLNKKRNNDLINYLNKKWVQKRYTYLTKIKIILKWIKLKKNNYLFNYLNKYFLSTGQQE